jgi:hypothetical protein
MIEFLKSVGSYLGILTTIVFFYDRMAKGRPIGSLTIRNKEDRRLVCIRLSNPSDYDVAILGASVSPKVYYLVENLEVRTIIEAQMGTGPYFMLKPKEEKELILAPNFKDNVALEVNPKSVTFRIYWRRGNATWLWQWPVHICTSTQTIRKYGLQPLASDLPEKSIFNPKLELAQWYDVSRRE